MLESCISSTIPLLQKSKNQNPAIPQSHVRFFLQNHRNFRHLSRFISFCPIKDVEES